GRPPPLSGRQRPGPSPSRGPARRLRLPQSPPVRSCLFLTSCCEGSTVAAGQVRGRHQIRVIRAVDSAHSGLIPRGLSRRRIGVRRGQQGGHLKVDRATPRLIDRVELLAALDRAAARQVTIISAPAGRGKTSLLCAWADRPGQAHRLAMLQVPRDQNDAQQFWLALLGAVRYASATATQAEPPAATPEFNGRAMVDRVLSELADASDGITLVIDDLHELHSPDALAQLTRLLTSLPANVHAILATRRDLRLELHRLRLAGELAELRGAELRF